MPTFIFVFDDIDYIKREKMNTPIVFFFNKLKRGFSVYIRYKSIGWDQIYGKRNISSSFSHTFFYIDITESM